MEKVHISVTCLLITFFVNFFKTFPTDLKSAWNFAFFDTFFEEKNLKVIFVLFSNFEAKRAKNGPKKQKTFFFKHVLEFIYATINVFVHPSC